MKTSMVLIGPQGSGKSTKGPAIAEALGLEWAGDLHPSGFHINGKLYAAQKPPEICKLKTTHIDDWRDLNGQK